MRGFVPFLIAIVLSLMGGQSRVTVYQRPAQSLPAEPSARTLQATQQVEYTKTLQAIKRKRPEIPNDVLSLDTQIIGGALSTIKSNLEEVGLDEVDASEASLTAWRKVRIYSPLQPDKPMNADSFVEFVTTSSGLNSIKREMPEIPKSVLLFDRKVIDQALPVIKAKYEAAGLDEVNVVGASVFAWREVRFNSSLPPGKHMDANSFIEFTTNSIGLVTFKSDPDKAEVYVGGRKVGHTEVSKWYRQGTIKVLFKKGELSEEKDCEVTAPPKECKAELKPNK